MLNRLLARLQFKILFSLFLFVVVLDQTTKILMRKYFPNAVVYNTGAAFGILEGWQPLFVGLAAVIFVASLWLMNKSRWLEFSLLAAGAIGNLIDRIFFGVVVDFIPAGFWPTFNVADAALSAAVLLLVVRIVGHPKYDA